jgi:hypothetical protein
MNQISRFIPLLSLTLIIVLTGCSVFPGARVLVGEDVSAEGQTLIGASEFVMVDKSDNTDPALAAAADRIEAADPNMDIVEIRRNPDDDVFEVFSLLILPDANEDQLGFVQGVQRAMELTWQGTFDFSQGTRLLRINLLSPLAVPTIDKGLSFAGQVVVVSEITRDEAIIYMANRPNDVNDFVDLIAEGTLSYDQPQDFVLYEGTPNHPVPMMNLLMSQATQ